MKRPYEAPTITQFEVNVAIAEREARLALYDIEPSFHQIRRSAHRATAYALIAAVACFGMWLCEIEQGWKRVPRPVGPN